MPVLVQPRHDAGTTRHADRGGVVVPIKRHAFAGQPVDVWRLDFLVPVAP